MGGYPALMIQQPESPLKQFGEAEQIKGMMQQQQMGQIELQNARQQQIDTQSMTKAMAQWDGQDPNQIAHLVVQNGGSGKASMEVLSKVQAMRLQIADTANKDAETNSKNLESQIKTNDQYRGRIQAIINAPANQKQPLWEQEITAEEQSGKIKPGQMSHTYPGDEQATVLANHFALGSVLAKEHTEAVTAQARASQAATAATKLPAEMEHLAAQTALEKTQQQQAGQVTEKDKYIQGQENYRASLGRAATTANEVGKQGIAALQKQGDAYSEFAGKANILKANIQLAKDGNEMAAAISPLAGTLFIVKGEGNVSRINETEVRGLKDAGDLVTKINGAISKLTTGSVWPDSLKNDMVKLVDIYTDAKYESYKKQAAYTVKLHSDPKTGNLGGFSAGQAPILNKDGTFGEQAAEAKSGMIRARDPNGVLHEAKKGTALPKGWTLE